MSNKTSKERTNSNDYHNGDEICKKCIGITYFSANLREKKYSPVCFGWRKNVEDLTRRKTLEDIHSQALRNEEYDDSKDFAYVCNGISETTGKLDRQGAIPNCYGIKILFIEDEKKRRQKNATSNDREISRNDPNKIPDPVSRKLDEEITKQFKETFEEYTNLKKLRIRMTRGVKRQWKW